MLWVLFLVEYGWAFEHALFVSGGHRSDEDIRFVELLALQNATVTHAFDVVPEVMPDAAWTADLIIISDTAVLTERDLHLIGSRTLLTWHPYVIEGTGMGHVGADTGAGSAWVHSERHPLLLNISASNPVLSSSSLIGTKGVSSDAYVVLASAAGVPVLYVYEQGARLANGAVSPGVRIGWGIPGRLEEEGEALLNTTARTNFSIPWCEEPRQEGGVLRVISSDLPSCCEFRQCSASEAIWENTFEVVQSFSNGGLEPNWVHNGLPIVGTGIFGASSFTGGMWRVRNVSIGQLDTRPSTDWRLPFSGRLDVLLWDGTLTLRAPHSLSCTTMGALVISIERDNSTFVRVHIRSESCPPGHPEVEDTLPVGSTEMLRVSFSVDPLHRLAEVNISGLAVLVPLCVATLPRGAPALDATSLSLSSAGRVTADFWDMAVVASTPSFPAFVPASIMVQRTRARSLRAAIVHDSASLGNCQDDDVEVTLLHDSEIGTVSVPSYIAAHPTRPFTYLGTSQEFWVAFLKDVVYTADPRVHVFPSVDVVRVTVQDASGLATTTKLNVAVFYVAALVASGGFALIPDDMYSANDTLTVSFSTYLNVVPGASLDKDAVDELFSFSHSIGDDYKGTWENDHTLILTVIDPALDTPPIGALRLTVLDPAALVENGLWFDPSGNVDKLAPEVSPPLTGAWASLHLTLTVDPTVAVCDLTEVRVYARGISSLLGQEYKLLLVDDQNTVRTLGEFRSTTSILNTTVIIGWETSAGEYEVILAIGVGSGARARTSVTVLPGALVCDAYYWTEVTWFGCDHVTGIEFGNFSCVRFSDGSVVENANCNFEIQPYNHRPCSVCNCTPGNALSCNVETRECRCNTGSSGPRCSLCEPLYYADDNGQCHACQAPPHCLTPAPCTLGGPRQCATCQSDYFAPNISMCSRCTPIPHCHTNCTTANNSLCYACHTGAYPAGDGTCAPCLYTGVNCSRHGSCIVEDGRVRKVCDECDEGFTGDGTTSCTRVIPSTSSGAPPPAPPVVRSTSNDDDGGSAGAAVMFVIIFFFCFTGLGCLFLTSYLTKPPAVVDPLKEPIVVNGVRMSVLPPDLEDTLPATKEPHDDDDDDDDDDGEEKISAVVNDTRAPGELPPPPRADPGDLGHGGTPEPAAAPEASVTPPPDAVVNYTHGCGQPFLPFPREQVGMLFSCPLCKENFTLTEG